MGQGVQQFSRVGVVCGGTSTEREVSLSSGRAVSCALERLGLDFELIDWQGRQSVCDLLDDQPDVVFNALHGSPGEDGVVQGVFETLGLPYTHSGVLSSAVAMDKHLSRLVFERVGVPVARGQVLCRGQLLEALDIDLPCVVKPLSGGSSVGVSLVFDGHGLEQACSAGTADERVLVEAYVPGRELTCAVLFDHPSAVIEIVQDNAFYDYEAKYAQGGSRHICPADLEPHIYRKVQDYTLQAHLGLGCRGVSRADFRFDEATGQLVCLEVNTQPGLTETSLVPELAAYEGLSFDDLVRLMLEDASCSR